MSRTVKFRAWDCKGSFYRSSNSMEWWVYPDGRICHNGDPLRDGEWILEMFTGLHDKNGKEIYEGDILVQLSGKSAASLYLSRGPVEFRMAEFMIGRGDGSFGHICEEDSEIIGNVHQTPELLKERP